MNKIGLFLDAEPHSGGAFQYSQAILESVSSLRSYDCELVAVTFSEYWADSVTECGIKILALPKDFLTRNFNRPRIISPPVTLSRVIFPLYHSLTKTLVREQCNLWIFPSQDVWSFQVPVPSLVSVHDLMHRYEKRFPEVSAKGEYRMREWTYRNICKWAKGLLVDSEMGKRHIEESYGYRSDRIFVLPFIAPTVISSPDAARRFESRYHLPDKFIFYPAQFWQHKNHLGLIKAIAKLKPVLPDLKCVLVGSSKNGYQSALDVLQTAGLEQDIIVLGYVPDEDIPEFYRRARALVMPTFFGPTNIPPLEAFANGCPVATSRIYGIPDQVGDAALLFDPGSVDDIAGVIKRIWTDDRLCEELRMKGRQKTAAWGQVQFDVRLREIVERVLSMSCSK